MKKIDIEKALENSDVAKALSEFTVNMMSNSNVTKNLREAFAQVQDKDKDKDTELKSTSKKLIQAIESYNKKSRRVNISDKTTVFDKNTTFIYKNPDPLYKKDDIVFYVDFKNKGVVKAKIIHIEYAVSPPSYTIKRIDVADNAELNVDEYTLRVYDKVALYETKNVWLAEVNLRKVDEHLIIVKKKISKLNADLDSIRQNNDKYNENEDYKNLLKEKDKTEYELNHLFGERREAVSAVKLALAQEDKATGGVPLSKYKMNERFELIEKWDMDPLKEVLAKAKEAYDDARKKVDDVDVALEIENSKLGVTFYNSDNDNIKTQIGLLNAQQIENKKAMKKARDALIEAANAIPYYENIEIQKHKPPPPYRRRTRGKKWAFTGGRNRRTKKAHYYSKRRRTRHYRSKRVRSK